MRSEIMKILFEVFKAHLIFIDFSILITVFDFVQSHFPSYRFKHYHDIFGNQIPLST